MRARSIDIVLCALARKEVAHVEMSPVHALSCTRPRRLGIMQCSAKHALCRLQKSTDSMLRDIHVCPVCTSTLPPKTLLDAHKYTNNEQHCIESCHHIERTSWPCAVEQRASSLGKQQDAKAA